MLIRLDIRDMLIIDHLGLDFQPGLNVLTGETGAGKSILLDSLGFVLGWRGRADLVREGADQGEVIAVFALPSDHPGWDVLRDADLTCDPDEDLILRRVNARDGRKTSYINDRRVSGEVLRRLSDTLVELHGQHDDRGLLNPRGHRALLDDFGRLGPDLAKVRAAWRQVAKLQTELAEAQAALDDIRAEEDFLRHAVEELDALSPQAGEEATLDARRRLMQGAAKIREDVARAYQAISNEGAEGLTSDAIRWLDGAAGKAEGVSLDAGLAALARALNEMSEAQAAIEDSLDALDFDPLELERTEERLFAIRGLARKHSVQPDDLADFAEKLRDRLSTLDAGQGNIDALRKALAAARATYDDAARGVSEKRAAAAARLDRAMAEELAPLKMERAVFSTHILDAAAGPDGTDEVSFTVATNPGAPAGPLAKIASGGELSRFLLALKVCLRSDQSSATMIFDEIDRGVGGATADAVGRRLAALADDAQVLVVTHSPQVAARGAHHWQVAKTLQDGKTLSRVTALDAPARVDEIARMLSGDTITDPARAAAEALLAG